MLSEFKVYTQEPFRKTVYLNAYTSGKIDDDSAYVSFKTDSTGKNTLSNKYLYFVIYVCGNEVVSLTAAA